MWKIHGTNHQEVACASLEHSDPDRAVWLRIPQAVRTRGIGRSTLYALICQGKVKSRVLKARRDSVRGIRLISADSLDAFIERAGQ